MYRNCDIGRYPIQKSTTMNQRIAQFEIVWNERLRVRLSPALGPDPDILSIPIPRLIRQTNQHELLSQEHRVQWFNAETQAERDAIMAEEGL